MFTDIDQGQVVWSVESVRSMSYSLFLRALREGTSEQDIERTDLISALNFSKKLSTFSTIKLTFSTNRLTFLFEKKTIDVDTYWLDLAKSIIPM